VKVSDGCQISLTDTMNLDRKLHISNNINNRNNHSNSHSNSNSNNGMHEFDSAGVTRCRNLSPSRWFCCCSRIIAVKETESMYMCSVILFRPTTMLFPALNFFPISPFTLITSPVHKNLYKNWLRGK